MNYLQKKRFNSLRRSHRVRSKVIGTTARPRLSVRFTNLHVIAQIIDDSKGATLVYVSSIGQKDVGNTMEKAVWAGKEIALKAKKAKISKVAFDRGEFKYHGKVKELADAARNEGLEF